MKKSSKTIIIVGPTTSGKSDLAIALARKYNGEIISADSRQVYRGMDIGTGKVLRDRTRKSKIKNQKSKLKNEEFFSEKIRHHLLDIVSPKENYNVTHFVRDAKKIITGIKKRGKIPIICGGTGFWVQALIEDTAFPAVKPDMKLRTKLGKLSEKKLFILLQKKDPRRASSIDRQNKVRLIRALEICQAFGTVPLPSKSYPLKAKSYLIIALNPPKEQLQKNIKIRLEKRLKQGMVAEVKHLRTNGISWKKLESFGLEYKYVALLLQKKITKQEMSERLNIEIWHYAKRQITWLKRFEKMGAHIHWLNDVNEAHKIISSFYKSPAVSNFPGSRSFIQR